MEINGFDPVSLSEKNEIKVVKSSKRSILNKFLSGITTIAMIIFGKNSSDARGNRGLQLTSPELRNYIGKLEYENKNFSSVLDFVEGSFELKNTNTLLSKLEKSLNAKNLPVFIPIVLKGNSPIEAQHIVCIVVDPQTKKIEYFDSQGVTADNRVVDGDLHMIDLLNGIKSILNKPDSGKAENYTIVQNTKSHQMDCHNCGAFVGYYAKERFKKENPSSAGKIFNTEISLIHDIHPIRNEMKISGW